MDFIKSLLASMCDIGANKYERLLVNREKKSPMIRSSLYHPRAKIIFLYECYHSFHGALNVHSDKKQKIINNLMHDCTFFVHM